MTEPAATAPAEAELPFTVRLVATEEELHKAVRIRHATYARQIPALAAKLRYPESADTAPGVVNLLAQSKAGGVPVGAMRIQTNQFGPLLLEQSVALPMRLKETRLIEASRFGVTHEAGADLVEMALFKACYLYCRQIDAQWMVIAGRAPIDAQYESLMFEDIFPGLGFIPLLHADNLPHRIMSLSVAAAQERWAAAKHPHFDFHFNTRHPDIDLSGPVYTNLSPIKRTAYPQLSAGNSKY
jgi:hypothetical protein